MRRTVTKLICAWRELNQQLYRYIKRCAHRSKRIGRDDSILLVLDSAAGFVSEWWDASVARGDIVEMAEGYRLTPKAEATLLERLASTAGSDINKPV